MDIQDAQREVRTVYIGGFWGQFVSSVIWLASAALGTWVSPKASILAVVIGGFFIFLLVQILLRLSGRRASVSGENPFNGHHPPRRRRGAACSWPQYLKVDADSVAQLFGVISKI